MSVWWYDPSRLQVISSGVWGGVWVCVGYSFEFLSYEDSVIDNNGSFRQECPKTVKNVLFYHKLPEGVHSTRTSVNLYSDI